MLKWILRGALHIRYFKKSGQDWGIRGQDINTGSYRFLRNVLYIFPFCLLYFFKSYIQFSTGYLLKTEVTMTPFGFVSLSFRTDLSRATDDMIQLFIWSSNTSCKWAELFFISALNQERCTTSSNHKRAPEQHERMEVLRLSLAKVRHWRAQLWFQLLLSGLNIREL